jgi:uncharacterized membrane protein YidH (DUF202 family)
MTFFFNPFIYFLFPGTIDANVVSIWGVSWIVILLGVVEVAWIYAANPYKSKKKAIQWEKNADTIVYLVSLGLAVMYTVLILFL